MTRIEHLADLNLVRRVEAAWDALGVESARAQQRYSAESQAEWLAVGGGHAVFMGVGSPLSQAQGIGLSGAVDDGELDLMDTFFRERGTPPQIEVASLADPSLLTALSLRGYLIAEQTHCLVCSLRGSAPGSVLADDSLTDSGIEVAPVRPRGWERFVDLVLRSFFEGVTPPPTLRQGMIPLAKMPGNTGWLALLDGEPAGGGSLTIHDGLALLCGDGTLPRFRRRGVHSALLQARLEYARENGCDLAVICTQPGGGSQRNAQRLGFRISHARTMMVRYQGMGGP